MKTKLGALILAGSLLASGNASADVESWYALWSLGTASLSYGDSNGEYLDSIGSRTQGSIDMLGFYWPMADKQTIVGGVISGAFDSASDYYGTVQINQYLYAISALHFFGSEPGDGFFVRGDLGSAKASVTETYSNGYYTASGSLGSGTGYLVGAGFGIPVSSQSRLLISLVYSNKSIDSVDYTSTGLIISGLW
jgi:hypothetical protein